MDHREEDEGSCFHCWGSGIVEDFDGTYTDCPACSGTGVGRA
jgi:hypothetical protein